MQILWTQPNLPVTPDQVVTIRELSNKVGGDIGQRLVAGLGRTGSIGGLTEREASAVLTALVSVVGVPLSPANAA